LSRLPGDDVVGVLCEAAHRDLDRIAALWPAVREQRRLGPYRPERLPTAPAGADLSDLPPPTWADPTGEAAVNARAIDEHADRDALVDVLDVLSRVAKARIAMSARLPALDANIAAVTAHKRLPGQPGTALTAAVVLGTRATTTSDCMLCERPATRIRGGWCDACYSSWTTWKSGRVADRDEFCRWRLASLAA